MLDDSSSHYLLGKFFTNSTPPSFEETDQSLRRQWDLSGDMTVQKLVDGKTFLFEFREKNDKEEVLQKGPFNVNGVIIVIKDLIHSDQIDFTVASFIVAVVGLPSYLYTDDFFPTLRSLVGDDNSFYLRKLSNNITGFEVDVDLKKPLRPGFYIDENQNRFVEFKYRNLGDFCYNCGMIGHVKENCVQVKFPKERALNATSRTHVYGPWLRLSSLVESSYQFDLTKSPNGVGECDKTLSYPQFFIEVEFKRLAVFDDNISMTSTVSTHRFRFPCSYLDDTESDSTDSVTSSKAYEVLESEIYENIPRNFRLRSLTLKKPYDIGSLVEQLKVIKKDKFCCEDKWLTLKLQITVKHLFTPVDYETAVAVHRERFIETSISNLIKERVEKNENLFSLSSWEDQIREAIAEMGFTHYMHPSYVSRRAEQAMRQAVRNEISLSSCTIPADKSTVLGLERFKVLGDDMDRLDPCVICAEEMFLAEEATILPCSHVFHSSCIEKWLQVGQKCPLCGFKLSSQR